MDRQVIPFNVEEAWKSQAIGRIVATLPSFSGESLDRLAAYLERSINPVSLDPRFCHARLAICDGEQKPTQQTAHDPPHFRLQKTPAMPLP